MTKQYYIYILTNQRHTTLYTGITNDLIRRIYEHKHKLADGFAKKYNLTELVYFETFATAYDAISREKQIKAGSRTGKIKLIEGMNPAWKDLYNDLL